MITYSVSTDDPKIAKALFEAAGHALAGSAATGSHQAVFADKTPVLVPASPPAAPAAVAPPSPPSPPSPPVAPPAPLLAPLAVAPPVAPPAPPAPTKVKGVAPEGWMIEHITSAAKSHADKHGPASLKALVAKYGEKKATEVDPALWPQFHAELSA